MGMEELLSNTYQNGSLGFVITDEHSDSNVEEVEAVTKCFKTLLKARILLCVICF